MPFYVFFIFLLFSFCSFSFSPKLERGQYCILAYVYIICFILNFLKKFIGLQFVIIAKESMLELKFKYSTEIMDS